jgi:nucleoside-diphosphate-sugar epimerase
MNTAARETPQNALIVGCGYVGKRLARALRPTYRVTGTVRSEASRQQLQSMGIDSAILNLDQSHPRPTLSHAQTAGAALFYLASPPAHGLSDTRLDRFLPLIDFPLEVFVYISTTGVYGDTNGGEVDETARVNPQTQRAERRVSAEEMTRVWCTENQVRRVVLRVPGIYGPGRLPIERLQRGEPVIAMAEAGITNRIHVDDLVSACIAAAQNTAARGVYNVTDGNSISGTEFTMRVAQLANLPEPPQISMDEARLVLSPERMSFLEESRRVNNRRMLKELGVQPRYADIDAGIRASLPQ